LSILNHQFNRLEIYDTLIDKLSKKAFDSLDAVGNPLIDPSEGKIWVGTVMYVIGELYRVNKIDLSNYQYKNLNTLLFSLLKNWKSQSEIDTCFMGIGLSSWGPIKNGNQIFSLFNREEQENISNQLKVTREFKTNWEAFNACIEGANSILSPTATNTLPIHLNKILDKYKETGYMDDSDNLGVYDSYGIMSLNYCVKAIELLDQKNIGKQEYLNLFQPHCLRYANLIKDLLYPDGSGWPFGRSVGVLGQLQYIIFLEQCIFHQFLDISLTTWARGAIKNCIIKMVDLFWDEEKQWFCFKDEHHTCYSYRNTYPMHWDILRYFIQAKDYASKDLQVKTSDYVPEKKCKEIITNGSRKTSIFIWSDSIVQFVIPIMGSSLGKLATDTAAKPHCRGLIEGVTEGLKPIWSPALTIEGKTYYPTNQFLKSSIFKINEWDVYEVQFEKIYASPKEDSSYSKIQVTTQYCFASGKFKRIDQFKSSENCAIETIAMEILQAAPHPKRIAGYGKVYQINPKLKTNIPSLKMGEKTEIGNDPTYRNFFGRPSHKWVMEGKNLTFTKDEVYSLEVAIEY
jgi:hypothetical protein